MHSPLYTLVSIPPFLDKQFCKLSSPDMVLQLAAHGQMASAGPLSAPPPPCSFRGSASQLTGNKWCVRQPQRAQLQVRPRI